MQNSVTWILLLLAIQDPCTAELRLGEEEVARRANPLYYSARSRLINGRKQNEIDMSLLYLNIKSQGEEQTWVCYWTEAQKNLLSWSTRQGGDRWQ